MKNVKFEVAYTWSGHYTYVGIDVNYNSYLGFVVYNRYCQYSISGGLHIIIINLPRFAENDGNNNILTIFVLFFIIGHNTT